MRLVLALALGSAVLAVPAGAQVSVFAANEVRAARLKDFLRLIRTNLKDGTDGAKRHAAAVTEAFKETEDWAPSVEEYYARKGDLLSRAAALDAKLDAVIARNSPEKADDVTKAIDEIFKAGDVLRSDFEFYMYLPRAAGPQRKAAQAAMRLLGRTGDFPVSLAYYLDKTPHRPPFAPMQPGVMAIRHR